MAKRHVLAVRWRPTVAFQVDDGEWAETQRHTAPAIAYVALAHKDDAVQLVSEHEVLDELLWYDFIEKIVWGAWMLITRVHTMQIRI